MSAMCHEFTHCLPDVQGQGMTSLRALPKSQGGFAIVAAIFLLVVLAALGGFMMTFSSVQQTTSSQDLLGSRAYQAARAGMEWGVFQADAGTCAASTTLPALAADLASFSVVVTCTTFTPANENGAAVVMFQITSTATLGVVGSALYVERRLTATL